MCNAVSERFSTNGTEAVTGRHGTNLRLLVLLTHEADHTPSALHTLRHAVIDVCLHAAIDVHPAIYAASLQFLPGLGHCLLTIPVIDVQRCIRFSQTEKEGATDVSSRVGQLQHQLAFWLTRSIAQVGTGRTTDTTAWRVYRSE